MTNNNIKFLTSDEELAYWAARGCYYPQDEQKYAAMGWVIERLVLSAEVGDYDFETMRDNILRVLKDHPRSGNAL